MPDDAPCDIVAVADCTLPAVHQHTDILADSMLPAPACAGVSASVTTCENEVTHTYTALGVLLSTDKEGRCNVEGTDLVGGNELMGCNGK